VEGAFILFNKQDLQQIVILGVPSSFLEVDGTMVDVYCNLATKRAVRFGGQVLYGVNCISVKKIPDSHPYGVDTSSGRILIDSAMGIKH
jgi:hypothetical protein